jgi:hypothetical protein
VARTHVIIDDAVLEAIDAIAGERGRSRFLEHAAREKLSRLALESAIHSTSGIVDGEDYPEWATSGPSLKCFELWGGCRRLSWSR